MKINNEEQKSLVSIRLLFAVYYSFWHFIGVVVVSKELLGSQNSSSIYSVMIMVVLCYVSIEKQVLVIGLRGSRDSTFYYSL